MALAIRETLKHFSKKGIVQAYSISSFDDHVTSSHNDEMK
jgi:hypothetical protein